MTTTREKAIDYLKTIILPLCSFPFQIKDVLDERGLILTVESHEEDTPLLVGRKGVIANSLRNILHVWGTRNFAAVKLMIESKCKNCGNKMVKNTNNKITCTGCGR